MNEFKTLRLAQKRSAVEIESIEKYDIYSSVPTILKNNTFFKVYKGIFFYDIIGLVDPWNIAISERFKSILEQHGITGCKYHPIVVSETDLKYYVLEITGRADMICSYDEDGDVKFGSIKVDVPSWDGSDIFLLGKGGIKVVSDKLRLLIENNSITNVEFDDLENY